MSDPTVAPALTPIERGALADRVSELVLATSGVLRLEPTVRSAMVGLRSAASEQWRSLPAAVKRSADGVIVTNVDGQVDIAIDLATQFGHPAVEVAIAVRDRVSEALIAASIAVARIDVSVLTIGDE